jgi:hypothetical protein
VARELAAQFQQFVTVNMYWTPPYSQGFEAHYDDHCVVVLQLEGQKIWSVFEQLEELPELGSPRTRPSKSDCHESKRKQVAMSKGDCLYIPRGTVHCARTLSEASVHLTFAVLVEAPFTMEGFVHMCLASLPPPPQTSPRRSLCHALSRRTSCHFFVTHCASTGVVRALRKGQTVRHSDCQHEGTLAHFRSTFVTVMQSLLNQLERVTSNSEIIDSNDSNDNNKSDRNIKTGIGKMTTATTTRWYPSNVIFVFSIAILTPPSPSLHHYITTATTTTSSYKLVIVVDL